jgi:hypothetical protein
LDADQPAVDARRVSTHGDVGAIEERDRGDVGEYLMEVAERRESG